jgi:5'-nucleotidase
MKKDIIYVDMDGVLADFHTKRDNLPQQIKDAYENRADLIPNFFRDLPLIPGAKEAMKVLNEHFDVYILSTPPWGNPTAWSDKRLWIGEHFPYMWKKIILSHNKGLMKGEFLIDDTDYRGQKDFVNGVGEKAHIHFGQPGLENWDKVMDYIMGFNSILS